MDSRATAPRRRCSGQIQKANDSKRNRNFEGHVSNLKTAYREVMSMCVQVASYVAFSSQKAYRLAVSTESSAGIHSATFGDLEVDERAFVRTVAPYPDVSGDVRMAAGFIISPRYVFLKIGDSASIASSPNRVPPSLATPAGQTCHSPSDLF